MNKARLFEQLKASPRPVVVEFWAPWCMPCRAMAPALEQAARDFAGQVDLLKINADQHPELLRELGILGIPTILVASGGNELFRRTGAQSTDALQAIFRAALAGQVPARGIHPLDRSLRATAGVAFIALGLVLPSNPLILVIAGGALAFSAVYDRCPVYRAISAWLKGKLAS